MLLKYPEGSNAGSGGAGRSPEWIVASCWPFPWDARDGVGDIMLFDATEVWDPLRPIFPMRSELTEFALEEEDFFEKRPIV